MIRILPLDVARCDPSCPCPQKGRCLRFLDESFDPRLSYVDASTTRDPSGCALFLDTRGAALLVAQQLEAA